MREVKGEFTLELNGRLYTGGPRNANKGMEKMRKKIQGRQETTEGDRSKIGAYVDKRRGKEKTDGLGVVNESRGLMRRRKFQNDIRPLVS